MIGCNWRAIESNAGLNGTLTTMTFLSSLFGNSIDFIANIFVEVDNDLTIGGLVSRSVLLMQ